MPKRRDDSRGIRVRTPVAGAVGTPRESGHAPARGVLAVLLLAIAPHVVRAQEPGPLTTDRPDRTESAAAVAAGFAQFELGVAYGRDGGPGDASSLDLGEALARVGLGHGLEARLGHGGWTSVRTDGETLVSGWGDAEIGLKFARATADGTAIGLLGSLSLPVGDVGVGSPRADPSLLLLWARSFTDRLSLGANLGLARVTVETGSAAPGGEGGDPRTELESPWSVALAIGATERVGLFVELFGAFGLREGRPSSQTLDGGLTLLVRNGLQLDASAGIGLDDDARRWFIGSGLSVRIPR